MALFLAMGDERAVTKAHPERAVAAFLTRADVSESYQGTGGSLSRGEPIIAALVMRMEF